MLFVYKSSNMAKAPHSETRGRGAVSPPDESPTVDFLTPSRRRLLLEIPADTNTSVPVWEAMTSRQVDVAWAVNPYSVCVRLTPVTSQRGESTTLARENQGEPANPTPAASAVSPPLVATQPQPAAPPGVQTRAGRLRALFQRPLPPPVPHQALLRHPGVRPLPRGFVPRGQPVYGAPHALPVPLAAVASEGAPVGRRRPSLSGPAGEALLQRRAIVRLPPRQVSEGPRRRRSVPAKEMISSLTFFFLCVTLHLAFAAAL